MIQPQDNICAHSRDSPRKLTGHTQPKRIIIGTHITRARTHTIHLGRTSAAARHKRESIYTFHSPRRVFICDDALYVRDECVCTRSVYVCGIGPPACEWFFVRKVNVLIITPRSKGNAARTRTHMGTHMNTHIRTHHTRSLTLANAMRRDASRARMHTQRNHSPCVARIYYAWRTLGNRCAQRHTSCMRKIM